MVVFWRGYGILVLFAPLLCMLGAVLIMVGIGTYEPDEVKAAAMVYREGAAGLAVATVILWLVTRWRERVAPGYDQFTFIPMKYWTPVIALGALACFVASFVPAALRAGGP
jgi:MFS superfamily sulfate permease-like transporter